MNSLSQIVSQYKLQKKAIPAFNIDCFEIYQAVEKAVKETSLPCIVQLSAGEDKFIEAERLLILVKKAQIDGLPIFLNMDHSTDQERLLHLIKLGFDMVHFDNSQKDYQENLNLTIEFVKKAKEINPNILIEGEFNHINLIDKGVNPSSYTNPIQALEYVNSSKVDFLAVSIGNLHGISTNLPESIDLNLLSQIQSTIPSNFLTLHGGSGISEDQILSAIDLGIVKININTDLRLAFKNSLLSSFSTQNTEKIYQYLSTPVDDVAKVIVQKLKFFNR